MTSSILSSTQVAQEFHMPFMVSVGPPEPIFRSSYSFVNSRFIIPRSFTSSRQAWTTAAFGEIDPSVPTRSSNDLACCQEIIVFRSAWQALDHWGDVGINGRLHLADCKALEGCLTYATSGCGTL